MARQPVHVDPQTQIEDVEASNLEQFTATDTGGRHVSGWQSTLIVVICFAWALFQLYIASNLPFWLTEKSGVNVVVESFLARRIHLSFALVLAALAFPLFRRHQGTLPWYDFLLPAIGVAACFYAIVNYDDISGRAGSFQTSDTIAAAAGMAVLAIAVYRCLGTPLLIISSVFVFYVFFGDAEWLPDAIQWKGASVNKAMWHYWIQDEGVFGVAVKVSTELIFLFVLFGGILEKAGAGNYFIKIAFSLLGHLRGGPAKAAVMASAMSGLYSGSSIANTVTTGTFTIPLMKRTGFTPEKAGAIEVASSTNGQLTPPVMGAAAFLIAEFTGIQYTQLILHALVPALVSYIALIYIVHLEALKLDLKGLPPHPRSLGRSLAEKLLGVLTGFLFMCAMGAFVYYGIGWIKDAAPDAAFGIVALGCLLAYFVLVWIASRHPDLEVDDPNAPVTELPHPGDTAKTGYYFLLPILILIWCIVIERLSPALSAFWASLAMMFVAVTQHPLKAMMRGAGNLGGALARGISECIDGIVSGSRNMIAIGVATGVAGIIIGSVSLTGMHQVLGGFVEWLSGGNLIVLLILVAIMSLILGMGLPTTVNYIVVQSLMVPVIMSLAPSAGLALPLVAAHLFVFYFGILADDTPPVGLAAYAAAAISRGDPIKTGVQGFMYDIRTALLPFLFVFNTELLLIDVTPLKAVIVFIVAVVAMMLFAAATQGYFFARNRIWETAILLLVAFSLFRPGYWLDRVQPEFSQQPGTDIVALADSAPPGSELRLTIVGPDYDNPEKSSASILMMPITDPNAGVEALQKLGLIVAEKDGKMVMDVPAFNSPAQPLEDKFDFYIDDDPVVISEVLVPNERMPKEVFYLPALFLLGLVVLLQRRRQTKPAF